MAADTMIRRLVDKDLPALYRIRQIAFLDHISPASAEAQAWHRKTLPYKFGRFVDGELAACVSWYPEAMFLDGREQTVGALASVVSAAATRRRGHIRALMADGLQRLRDQGIGWCLEYPFDTRYYRQFGWETLANGFFFEVPIERFSSFDADATFQRVEPDQQTILRLDDIYRSWAAGYNFTMSRDKKIRDDWQNVLKGVPWKPSLPRFIFATNEAYCVVTIREEGAKATLNLVDFAFKSGEGRAALLSFFSHFRGQVQWVRLQLPADDPLVHEWANFVVAHPNPLQARVVDVEQAICGRSFQGSIELTLEVRDDFCSWNQGIYELRRDQDGKLQAKKIDQKAADISLDVRALAQLLSGSASPVAAYRAGLIEGRAQAVEQLMGLGRRTSFMSMADYF